jgi:hypothetical protein
MRILFVIVFLLLSHSPLAELDERIKVVIEEPTQGGSYSGISNLRGYAISPEGMGSYYLSVAIDGRFAFYMYPYGTRPDVGNAFPDYPDSDVGGFSMAFNYKDLVPGEHEIRVRAYDNADNYNDATTTFTTERFVGPFIADDAEVDLSTVKNVYLNGSKSLLVNGAKIEGGTWDFLLSWDRASQSFKTERISPVDSLGSGSNLGSSGNNGFANTAACVTSPVGSWSSSSEIVRMRNGSELNNFDGRRWDSGDSHIIFKTLNNKWYTLQGYTYLYRVDLTKEPDSCFEPDYYYVSEISESADGRFIEYGLSNGDSWFLDTVFSDCNYSATEVGHAIIYWEGFSYDYLLNLHTAEVCSST